MSPEDRLARPPSPPESPRRIRLRPLQWIGVPLLLLLPVALAALGLLGESWTEVRATSSELDVSVRWPTRFRYRQIEAIEAWVASRTGGTIDTVDVSLDTAYANRFSTVRAIPSLAAPYELSLVGVRPGERRLALIEIQADRYGRHTGELLIYARDTIRVELTTLVFP